ncbi:MAG: insulinase family protein [Bacteroidetes bacterium]|nr:MAG: insulinase family protein [Bacteroidota bacterium]REK07010.1 MAG: insulinase family protein [Bacteroidota bacterium]REK33643.1 MAG: insulinase family protein [Bacteroidota bacterium]REK48629.1 MAG: insulinase family protein [Bacteroidota bacterium]
MINYKRKVLDNGLTVIVHEDHSTPLATINILYKVGARDESPDKTGFAHLFEHLMFGGSVNIPSYDTPLQLAGGDNNAFTSNDITNYYLTLPSDNIDTGFWLESDRMLSLAFTEESLEVQRSVVIEEFKQRYLNQPYGDVWLLLRPLVYKVHPYKWATIGKEISHIENATLDDVKDFFYRFYAPDNAILVVAGNVKAEEMFNKAQEWFGSISRSAATRVPYPVEPPQTEKRVLTVERDVPFNSLYRAYHSSARTDDEYYAEDLLTDILNQGKSSRMYLSLVKEKKIFSEIHTYVSGSHDKGILVIEGKLLKGKTMEEADKAIDEELQKVINESVTEFELEKVKNKLESRKEFGDMDLGDRALNLASAEWLGDISLVNSTLEKYRNVSAGDIQKRAAQIFREENCSVLYYMSKN